MQLAQRSLYYPAITVIALTLTLTVIMVFSIYRNLNKGQEQMRASLELEASALLRLFEGVVHQGLGHPDEIIRFQQLAASVAPNDDVAYVYLFSEKRVILAHTDRSRIGSPVTGSFPVPGELLRLRNDSLSEHVIEVRHEFHSINTGPGSRYFVALGLRMTALEQVHQADHQHNIMMATILILLGSASLFFILVVQNFYLVQRTLDRTKSYVHYVIESMANGLISVDASGAVTTVNPIAADLLSVPEIDARGRHIDTLLPELSAALRQVLQEDTPILNRKIAYQRQDGTAIPMSISATQVKDHNQARLGAVIILNDLREVHELQERARRAEHLASIGRMAATVAHEIRNPLSSIRGFAQYFVGVFTKGEEAEYALAMVNESDRLNRVVSQLLDYARPLELNRSEVDIRRIFADVIRIIQMDAEKSNIEIRGEIDPGLDTLIADRDRLLQVLLNLAQNSVAAMPDGGVLTFQAAPAQGEGAELSVQDMGTGIPDEVREHLFEPFFTTKTRGSGLGLAVVRKIIDAHRGTIQVQSKLGEGTRMRLYLPS